MAQTGKKINELTAMSTVTDQTVLPGVYVESGVANSTANKISISQISSKVQNDMSSTLANKQDKLTAGTGITIEGNIISSQGKNYTAGTNVTITEDSDENYIINSSTPVATADTLGGIKISFDTNTNTLTINTENN